MLRSGRECIKRSNPQGRTERQKGMRQESETSKREEGHEEKPRSPQDYTLSECLPSASSSDTHGSLS
jgi:hypothetical protein